MRILIDECLPRQLKTFLSEHEVRTVPQMGWASKKNGELLKLMGDSFDIFVTFDKQMTYQQNLKSVSVAIVVLSAHKNRLDYLAPLMPDVIEAPKTIQKGDVVKIGKLFR